jgi:hypothetical protein
MLLSATFIGCATLGRTSEERDMSIRRNMASDWKLVVEDFDRTMMLDRPSRLTPNNM